MVDRTRSDEPTGHDRNAGRVEAVSTVTHSDLGTDLERHTELPDWSGRVLGQFTLQRRLAEGGNSVVYEGVQEFPVRRQVAVKLTTGPVDHRGSRWLIESQVLAQLRHPHIVPILDAGITAEGTGYIVMPLIRGIRIDQWIERQQAGPDRIVELMSAVADAVEYAHGRGVLHRDLKPSNILVDEAEQPIVTDFGLAKRMADGEDDPQTRTGVMLGSLGYLAPEQLAWSDATALPTVDVYGFGATLYRLLTGVPSIRRTSLQIAVEDLLNRTPPSIRRANPLVSRDLESICLKCLEKTPAKRYPNMGQVAEELQRVQLRLPTRARPFGPVRRWGRWVQREPLLAGLAAAMTVIILASGVTLTWLWQRAEHNYRRTEQYLKMAVASLEQEQRDASERLAEIPGSLDYRIHRLLQAIGFLERLSRENPANRFVRRRLAVAYYLLGQIPKHQGREQQAVTAFEMARHIFGELAQENPGDPSLRFDVFHSLLGLACAQSRNGQSQAAECTYQAALEKIEALAASHSDSPEYQDALACMLQVVASSTQAADSADAIDQGRRRALRAIAIATNLAMIFPDRPDYWRNAVAGWRVLAILASSQQRFSEARQMAMRSCDLARRMCAATPHDPTNREMLALSLNHAACWSARCGERVEGERYQREAEELLDRLIDAYPDHSSFRDTRERIAESFDVQLAHQVAAE